MVLEEKSSLFDEFRKNLLKHPTMTIRTSGSSGNPLMICLNDTDIENITRIGARCFKNAGITEDDRVVNTLNSSLWAGGSLDTLSFIKTGANVFNFSTGNTKALIELIMNCNITVLSCTPSYLDRIKEVCFSEFSKDPSELGLRLIIAGGEAGADNPEFRSRIESEWNARLINGNYGQADAVSVIASENYEDRGSLTFLGYPEVTAQILKEGKLLDPNPGVEGELILTTHWDGGLVKRTNYRSGDLIRISEKAENGKDFKFNIIGRADEMIVMRGLNVYPSTVDKVFQKVCNDYYVSGSFQIHVSKENPISKCMIVTKVGTDNFRRDLREELKKETSIAFDIVFGNPVMTDTGKVKRVVRDL